MQWVARRLLLRRVYMWLWLGLVRAKIAFRVLHGQAFGDLGWDTTGDVLEHVCRFIETVIFYTAFELTTLLSRHVVVHLVVDTQLLADDVGQRGAVSQVDPVAHATALLCILPFLEDDPVEALGTGDWRAEPDLLVRRLLVEHVAELPGDEVDSEDAGLCMSAVAPRCQDHAEWKRDAPSTQPRCRGSSLAPPPDARPARSGTRRRARGTRKW